VEVDHSGSDAILETQTHVNIKNFNDPNWIESEKFNKIEKVSTVGLD
jgi:hypothetical protein